MEELFHVTKIAVGVIGGVSAIAYFAFKIDKWLIKHTEEADKLHAEKQEPVPWTDDFVDDFLFREFTPQEATDNLLVG